MTTPPLFFFGAMSPYSWFAAERIGGLMPDAEWRPVFAGGLFRSSDRTSWGLDERRATGMVDCETRAVKHGLGPMIWPEPWPTNDLHVARAMVAAEHHGRLRPLALAAMRLAFLEGADLGEPSVVLEAGERAGLHGTELESDMARPEVKDGLRAANDAALALGVFGVPTVVVGHELFWGDDRLEAAAAVA